MHKPTMTEACLGLLAVVGVFALIFVAHLPASSIIAAEPQQAEPLSASAIPSEGYAGIPHQRRAWNRETESRIYWRTPRVSGASPLAVLKATAKQMESEQGTPLGNDANARALVLTMQAIAILEGRKTETADGTPIIE